MTGDFYLPPKYCLRHNVAIAEQKGAEIKFLMANLDDECIKSELRKSFANHVSVAKNCGVELATGACGAKVFFEPSSQCSIRRQISENFGIPEILPEKTDSFSSEAEDTSTAENLLFAIISEARKKSATDIHIENSLVRFRIFGRLCLALTLQVETFLALVRHIKTLSRIQGLENGSCCEGQFIHGVEGKVFVRVSCVSGSIAGGEAAVLRILDTERVPLSLGALGFSAAQCLALESLCADDSGLVLVCGAAASGKSTTAAALLLELQKKSLGSKKIVSVANPPEYILDGVTHLKLREAEKSSILPLLVHQDADVIFFGEVCGRNTAQAAVAAALAGHLVFAELHADSAANAVRQLRSLGVELETLLPVLRGIVSQSLLYTEDSVGLVADVSVTCEDLRAGSGNDLSRADNANIEKLFSHTSNAASYLKNAVARFPQPSWKKSLRVSGQKPNRAAV